MNLIVKCYRFDSYMTPDPSQLVQNMQWVYEYENPEFYNMLVQQ
jgi:hypothetical protein